MSYLSELTAILRNAVRSQSRLRLTVANYSKSSAPKDEEVYDEDKEEQKKLAEIFAEEVDEEAREKEIEKMRNKSKLRDMHRRFLNNEPINPVDYQWDRTVLYARQQYGRYGEASGFDPRLCFETPDEADDKREYERVAYPYTVLGQMEANRQAKAEKAAAIREREDKIEKNLEKMDKWTSDLNARIAKKEKEALEAKEKRERIMEEVRQHFGFKIDFRDPRFQALIEEKEKEQKKAKKAERKKKQEQVLMERLSEQAKELTKKKTVETNKDDDSDDDNDKKNKKK